MNPLKNLSPHPEVVKFITSLGKTDEQTAMAMAQHLNWALYKAGDCLIEQGSPAQACYFILKGMVRKFDIDELGVETTYGFYSERQSVVVFYQNEVLRPSPYSFVCLEETLAIIGDMENTKAVSANCPELLVLSQIILEETMDQVQDNLSNYIRLSPEERVRHVYDNRPELFYRVPQHQLASYLNLTPESLSRIKKRLNLTFEK